jgi:hypothetical protein
MVTESNNETNNNKKETVKDKNKKDTEKDKIKNDTEKDKNKKDPEKDKNKKDPEKDKNKNDTEKDKKDNNKDQKNKTKTSTTNKKKDEKKGGPVDEKGNPFPIDNPDGGDPICPGGYKIDYDFDPFNDPINPPFRCISSLKDPSDGAVGKAIQMANNPSAGVANATTGEIPAFGGRNKYRKRTRKIKRSRRRRSHRRKKN